jgi:hypothetical protein
MRKHIGVLLLSFLALLLPSCEGTVYLAKPNDTNLEYWITEDVSGKSFSSYEQQYGWFGAQVFYGKGYVPVRNADREVMEEPEVYVLYTVTSYPDFSDARQCVTDIQVRDPAITFYGLSLSSSYADFDAAFRKRGFQVNEETSSKDSHTAKRGRLTVWFQQGTAFGLAATVTNRYHVVF